jgi:Ca-activated chloride channel family protein
MLVVMKTTVQLDYQAIVANQAQPVHLAFQFTAPAHAGRRDQPIALSVVLDRSGSMSGDPLHAALRATKTVVQNLRREDQFSLVTFEDTAQVVIPMGPITAKQAVLDRIDQIGAGGSTNLTGGWMLGRDELRNTPAGTVRRELLLTDGCLNIGIVEPTQVNQVVMGGLERDGIRTSTLGFGNDYDEDLLSGLAHKTGGTFYDANNADKLPEIFEAELDGLQKITVQNLRLRFKRLHFVDAIRSLGGYQELTLPEGRRDYSIGDLTADEERVAVFVLDVLPIPLVAGTTTPAASLDGEVLAELEILYDEITAEGITSQVESHQIRVRPTQSQADVQVNREVLPWVSAQQAAEIVNQAIVKRDAEDIAGARQLLEAGIARLKAYGLDDQIADGIQLLKDALKKLENPDDYIRSRKILRGTSVSYCKMSSSDFLNLEESTPAPSFKKPRPKAAEPIITPRPADPQSEPDNRKA